jgi:hypothetical protein
MIPLVLAKSALLVIAHDPQAIGRLCDYLGAMPNLETPTLGGIIWWEDLINVEGWRVQRNKLFGNCRILDPQNVRKAWGWRSRFTQSI